MCGTCVETLPSPNAQLGPSRKQIPRHTRGKDERKHQPSRDQRCSLSYVRNHRQRNQARQRSHPSSTTCSSSMPRNALNSVKPGEMQAVIYTQPGCADIQSDSEYKARSHVPGMRGSISIADIDNSENHSNNSNYSISHPTKPRRVLRITHVEVCSINTLNVPQVTLCSHYLFLPSR